MSSLPTTIHIPTPSPEELVQLTRPTLLAGKFTYMDTMAQVYMRSDEVISDTALDTHRSSTILFCIDDDWYIQTHRPAEDTIELSLASLFAVQPWQIVVHAPIQLIEEEDGWRAEDKNAPEFYKGFWSNYLHNYVDFAFEIRREFRCDIERADKMRYPRKVRKILETLFNKDDTTLYGSYEDYLHYYKQSLPDTPGKHTWARLRDYFRRKTLAAAAKEHIYILDPILFARLARCDEEDAKQPPGGLEEDWYEYTINNF